MAEKSLKDIKYQVMNQEAWDEEQQTLLSEKGYVEKATDDVPSHNNSSSSNSSRHRTLTVYSAIVTILLTLFCAREVVSFWSLEHRNAVKRAGLLLPEFKTRLRYHWVRPDAHSWYDETFSGLPSEPVEAAWNKLLHNGRGRSTGLFVSAEEAKQFNITDGALYEDGRYSGIVAMHHNLHCLRRLRQLLYYDDYYPNPSPEAAESNAHHLKHCLEVLRTSIMCTPDLSVLPLTPTGETEVSVIARPPSEQYCLDWDSYNDIMEGRN